MAPTTGTGLWMFFGMAYAITWLFELPVALSEDGLGVLPFTPTETGLFYVLISVGTLGPAVAALVTLRVTEGPGTASELLRRCVRWRVPVVWYLVAIPAVVLVPILAAFLVPDVGGTFTISVETVLMMVVLLVTVQLVVGALGEEPGWRGFALPRLQQRYGPLGASVLLGLLWAGWHAPLFVMPEWADNKGGTTGGTVLQYVLFTVALSILMTWVYHHARASVLLMILFHSAVNTSLSGLVEIFPGSRVAVDRVLLPAVIGFGVAAIAVVAATRGRLGRSEGSTGQV